MYVIGYCDGIYAGIYNDSEGSYPYEYALWINNYGIKECFYQDIDPNELNKR